MSYTERIAQYSKQKWRRMALFITVSIGVAALSLPAAASAATIAPRLVVSPRSSGQNINTLYTVSVSFETSKPTDAVEAVITYNPLYMQFDSVITTGTAFPVELPTRLSGNTVTVTRGIFAPDVVNKTSLLAQVRFKVLSKPGTASLQLAGNATYQGQYINPTGDRATLYIH